jgi:hypothetical protein
LAERRQKATSIRRYLLTGLPIVHGHARHFTDPFIVDDRPAGAAARRLLRSSFAIRLKLF